MTGHDEALTTARQGLRRLRAERAKLLASDKPTAVDLSREHRDAIDRIDGALDVIDGRTGGRR